MKTDYKNTKAFERFSRFLEQIKKAENDEDILNAGFDLVESYYGFKSQSLSDSTKKVIDSFIHEQKKL